MSVLRVGLFTELLNGRSHYRSVLGRSVRRADVLAGMFFLTMSLAGLHVWCKWCILFKA